MFARGTCVIFTCFLVIAVQADMLRLRQAGDFFKWRDVGAINVVMCSAYETYRMMGNLMVHRHNRFITVSSGLSLVQEPQLLPGLMSVSSYKLGVVLDYGCEFGKDFISQCSEHEMLNASYSWLIFGEGKDVLSDLESLKFRLDSEAMLALPDGTLWDLYKLKDTTPLNVTQAGNWSTSSGLKVHLNGTKVQRRNNFHAVHLNGTLVITELQLNSSSLHEIMTDSKYHPYLDSISRYGYIIFLILKDIYNFTLTYDVSNSWGYVKPDGGHDGMVGQVERGEVDLGLAPCVMFQHRIDTVDFVHPIWKFRACFVFRHPSTMGVYRALVQPLTLTAWICTALILFVVVVVLKLISYWRINKSSDTELSWSSNVVLVVGAIAQQGLSETSHRISVRIIFLFVLILSVVLYAFYGAAIVTALLSPPPKNIRTIRQLLESSIQMGVKDYKYARDLFAKSTDPLTLQVYKKKLRHPFGFMTVREGIERMRTKPYAFYAEDATHYRLIERFFSDSEKCALTEIELIPPFLAASQVKKGSPLRDYVSCGFLLMRERGVLRQERHAWHPRKPNLCVENASVAKVNMEAVMLAFVVLLGGVVFSAAILVAEIYLHRKRSKNLLQKQKMLQKISKNQ